MNRLRNNLPRGWAVEKFSNIAELRHGYQFRDYDFTETGIKVFKITQIKGDGHTDISKCSYIDESRLDQFKKFIIKKGDILIALTGATIGKIARFNQNEVVLQNYRVGNFFPINNKTLSKGYLYHFLASPFFYNQILTGQTQSAQQNIGKEDINNMSVILPPLPEQIAIAEILSALDDKIELNLQTNKTLEEMANALYKHWFVDFGPFQKGKFVASELGMIPEGWEVRPFFDLIDLLSGGTPKTSVQEYWNGNICWVSAKDIGSSNESFLVDTEKKITEEGLKNSSTKILPEDTIIIVARGSVGKYGIISQPMAMNQSCYGLYSKGVLSQSLVFLITQNIMKDLLRMSYGSVFDTITTNTFNSINIVIPRLEILSSINSQFDSLFKSLKQNTIENQTLKQTRDYLLPKLISGEIRVKQAEKKIKELI